MSYDDEINEFKKAERKAAQEVAGEQHKKQNEEEFKKYQEAEAKEWQKRWGRFVDKARNKSLVKNRDDKDVPRDQMFDQQLNNFLKEGANTTSDWREALTAILRLLTEFMQMLAAKKYEIFIEIHDAFNKKFQELLAAENPGNSKLKMLSKAAGLAGVALLNPAQTLWVPLKANIVQKLKSGGEEAVLPILQHQVDFNEGKVTVAPLSTETGVPITDALQRVFEHGVKLWLEGQKCGVERINKEVLDEQTNQVRTVLEGYKVTNPDGTVMTADDFNRIKKDRDNGLAAFLAGKSGLKYEDRPENKNSPRLT